MYIHTYMQAVISQMDFSASVIYLYLVMSLMISIVFVVNHTFILLMCIYYVMCSTDTVTAMPVYVTAWV